MASLPDEMTVKVRAEYEGPVDPDSLRGAVERLDSLRSTFNDHLDRLGLRLSTVAHPDAGRRPAAVLTEEFHGLADRLSVSLSRLEALIDRLDLP